MGLGLHGGGLASALFFARHGARVTVTDHRQDPAAFQAFLPELAAHGVRTVLGRHEQSDFTQTDLVVKNPAVPLSSPFLALARERGIPVETDLSIFLGLCPGPVLAVTGSKGKSTAASALARCLQTRYPDMASYIEDKKVLFASQKPGQFAVFNADDPWQRDFPQGTVAEVHWYSPAPLPPQRPGAFLQDGVGLRREDGRTETLLPARLA